MPPILIDGGEERRAGRRHKVSIRARWGRGEEADEVEGEVTNLGAGGCFVASAEPVREGDLVRLRFDLSGGGRLTIWGNVVFRVNEVGFGLRFSAFSRGGQREALRELLEEWRDHS